jgi:hypothetical protein
MREIDAPISKPSKLMANPESENKRENEFFSVIKIDNEFFQEQHH